MFEELPLIACYKSSSIISLNLFRLSDYLFVLIVWWVNSSNRWLFEMFYSLDFDNASLSHSFVLLLVVFLLSFAAISFSLFGFISLLWLKNALVHDTLKVLVYNETIGKFYSKSYRKNLIYYKIKLIWIWNLLVSKCSELRKSNNQEPEIDTDEVAPNIKRVDMVNKNIPSNENLDEF